MSRKKLIAIDLILASVFFVGMIVFYKIKGDYFSTACFVLLVLGAVAIARAVLAFLMKKRE